MLEAAREARGAEKRDAGRDALGENQGSAAVVLRENDPQLDSPNLQTAPQQVGPDWCWYGSSMERSSGEGRFRERVRLRGWAQLLGALRPRSICLAKDRHRARKAAVEPAPCQQPPPSWT